MTRAREPGVAWGDEPPPEPQQEAQPEALPEVLPKIRPYVLTGGRSSPRHALRLVSTVVAGSEPPQVATPESDVVLAMCKGQPRAVAEIAATLGQPVLVAKILISDLLVAGALVMPAARESDPTDIALLEAVRAGLLDLDL